MKKKKKKTIRKNSQLKEIKIEDSIYDINDQDHPWGLCRKLQYPIFVLIVAKVKNNHKNKKSKKFISLSNLTSKTN